ncbi:hypothetical protein RchiOBHm_Chr6g0261821 [Rosa chinensis]|uniref:Uncharacterized protein n=1 Tax=Rosa chinensis TaxID=74649 RepID=A0A2P6PNH5_ROSCH|nr:hypothetical protein RchiOBHm_Chr6g0261821 [Rosa chinensis]
MHQTFFSLFGHQILKWTAAGKAQIWQGNRRKVCRRPKTEKIFAALGGSLFTLGVRICCRILSNK